MTDLNVKKRYHVENDKLNLCMVCKKSPASCGADLVFGNGKGSDNVITCDGFCSAIIETTTDHTCVLSNIENYPCQFSYNGHCGIGVCEGHKKKDNL